MEQTLRKNTKIDYANLIDEHDACGIGAVVNIDGHRDYETLDNALTIVEKLEHRAGKTPPVKWETV